MKLKEKLKRDLLSNFNEPVNATEWVQVQGNVDSRSEIHYTWSVTEPVSTLSGGDYSHPL